MTRMTPFWISRPAPHVAPGPSDYKRRGEVAVVAAEVGELGGPAAPPPKRRAGKIVLVVGLVLMIGAGVVGLWKLFGGIGSGRVRTPGTVTRDLGEGPWVIYQRTGTDTGDGSTSAGQPTMTGEEVRVTGPDGRRILVTRQTGNGTITINDAVYSSALGFHAPQAGTYRLEFTVPRGDVLVQRKLVDTFVGALPWLAAAAVGLLLTIGGGITAGVQRSRTRRANAYTAPGGFPVTGAGDPTPGVVPGPPPPTTLPGWYPDPHAPGRRRWWNGGAWTDRQG